MSSPAAERTSYVSVEFDDSPDELDGSPDEDESLELPASASSHTPSILGHRRFAASAMGAERAVDHSAASLASGPTPPAFVVTRMQLSETELMSEHSSSGSTQMCTCIVGSTDA